MFRSTLPLAPASVGFVAGVFKEKLLSPSNKVFAAVDHTHQYMLPYCVDGQSISRAGSSVVEKASHFLSTVFSYESIAAHAILPSTTLVFVKEPPEPYCVCKNLLLIDRDLLIGEHVGGAGEFSRRTTRTSPSSTI